MADATTTADSWPRLTPALREPAPLAEPPRAAARASLDDAEELARYTTWDTPGSSVCVSHLQVSGLHCAACAGDIERALCAQPGVLGAEVNAAARRAKVRWDASLTRASALVGAVEAAGYQAVPDVARSARELRERERRDVLWRLFVGSFLAMQVMMLATPSYVAGPGDLSDDLRQLLAWGQWVLSVPVLAFSAGPFLAGAWRALRRRRIGMDVPVSLGLLVTFVVSTAVAFDPTGPFGHELYFDSMTMFVAFLWFGRWLEMNARHRAAETLERSLQDLPQDAWRVADDGSLQAVPVARLRVGDRVRVPAGAALPADGVLVSEVAAVEEALLTGEAQAVPKQRGEWLLAGSVNAAQAFEMDVRQVGAATRQAAIAALMRDALACRPDVVRLADRWAGPFLWTVLLLAVGGGLAWLAVDPSRAVWVVVSVLIVTCPCALSLATPATWVATASGLAQRGVLLRRLESLQAAAGLQQLFLDKTGTLTQTVPQLLHVEPQSADARDLGTALALARWSAHPLSRALQQGLPERLAAEDVASATAAFPSGTAVVEQAGQGLQATDTQGRRWRLGSARWAADGAAVATAAADIASADARAGEPGAEPAQLVLACDGEVRLRFAFGEALRPGAQDAVAALRGRGVALTLLSGDSPARARRVAQALGLDDVRAAASPERKLGELRAAQAQGRLCGMLGDGLNDGAVLAAADLGIAMGEGAALAQQQADVVLLQPRLEPLVDLMDTARKSLRIVRQNLVWSATYNMACIPAALVGWLPPWAAGLGMAASSLLVVLNAQRAAR